MSLPSHRIAALTLVAKVIAKIDPSVDERHLKRLSRMMISGDLANDLFDVGISLPLPAAAPPSDGRLKQVRSVKDLRLAAKRFRPCVQFHAQQCLDGISAFYVWRGAASALVEMQKVLGTVWVVTDIRGLKNSVPPDHTCELIRGSFAQVDDHLNYEGLWPEDLFL